MLGKGKGTKLLILGLDGLDHSLVLKWELPELLQDYHGKFYVGGISRLYTPLIWSSILCGFNVEKEGYDYEKAVRKSMGKLGPLHVIKRALVGEEKRMFFARKILGKLGLLEAPRFIMPKELLKNSFLESSVDLGYSVFALEVPGYNEAMNGVFRLEMPELAISGSLKAKSDFIDRVKEESMRRLSVTRDALTHYDILMCYLLLPDLGHHLFFKGIASRMRMVTLYKWLHNAVNRTVLKYATDLGYSTLILSDHGFDMKKYDHTEWGFWSSNFQTEIKRYEDIRELVLSLL